MARIRIIKKNAGGIYDDSFKDIVTTLDSSNLPAYVTIKDDGPKVVVNLSYTGSTEGTIEKKLKSGIDVSIGCRSGRIVKIGGHDIYRHINEILSIHPESERARNNIKKGIELIRELR